MGEVKKQKEAIQNAQKYGFNLSEKNYINDVQRPFGSYEKYVIFATNANYKDSTQSDFWNSFADFEKSQDMHYLEKAISQVQAKHAQYHTNAAIIYLNCAIIFSRLGDDLLAKNSLVKAENLDKQVVVDI